MGERKRYQITHSVQRRTHISARALRVPGAIACTGDGDGGPIRPSYNCVKTASSEKPSRQKCTAACNVGAQTDRRAAACTKRSGVLQKISSTSHSGRWRNGQAKTLPKSPKVCSGVHTFHHGHYGCLVQQRAQGTATAGRSGLATTACRRHHPRSHLGKSLQRRVKS